MQFVDTAKKLEAFTLSCCMKAPKRYTFFLTSRIMQLASDVHEHAAAANNIWPTNQHEAQMRRDELTRANIKEQPHIRGYGRYMDDGYLICEDVRYLEECAARIRQYCAGIGLQLSEKKTRILPIRQGVRFLKTKFKLTQTGGVIRKVQRKSTRKMRQKLRKFRRWVDDGRMTEEDVRTSYESWKGHMRRGNSWKVLRKTDKLYRKLFGEKGDHQCTKFGRTGA